MKLKFVVISCIISLLSLFSAWESHHGHPFSFLHTDSSATSVKLTAKAYSSKESKRQLDSNIPKHGIIPIQITVENPTAKSYSISASGFNVAPRTASSVSTKVLLSAVPRSVALSAASLVFWPFMIPSAINSIITHHAHRSLQRDLKAKEVKDEVVAPYSSLHRILFVKAEDLPENLHLTLIDLKTLKPLECSAPLETT